MTAPSQAVIGAKAEAVLRFYENSPSATIEEIMAFQCGMDAGMEILKTT